VLGPVPNLSPIMSLETSPAPSPGLFSRLANIFVSPGEVFAAVKDAPVVHANWVAPAIAFVLVSWLVAGLMFSSENIQQEMREVQRVAMQKQFQKFIDQGKMTQAQVDQTIGQTEHFSGVFQTISGVVMPVMSAGVLPFWGGFVLWAGSHLMMRRPFPFMKGVELAGLTLVIGALGALVKGLLCVAKGTMFTGVGAVLLLDPYDPTNQVHNSLALVEVFAVWALAVKSIGLARLCEGSFMKAAVWVFGVWLALTGGMLGIAWAVQRAVATMNGLQ